MVIDSYPRIPALWQSTIDGSIHATPVRYSTYPEDAHLPNLRLVDDTLIEITEALGGSVVLSSAPRFFGEKSRISNITREAIELWLDYYSVRDSKAAAVAKSYVTGLDRYSEIFAGNGMVRVKNVGDGRVARLTTIDGDHQLDSDIKSAISALLWGGNELLDAALDKQAGHRLKNYPLALDPEHLPTLLRSDWRRNDSVSRREFVMAMREVGRWLNTLKVNAAEMVYVLMRDRGLVVVPWEGIVPKNLPWIESLWRFREMTDDSSALGWTLYLTKMWQAVWVPEGAGLERMIQCFSELEMLVTRYRLDDVAAYLDAGIWDARHIIAAVESGVDVDIARAVYDGSGVQ